MHDQPQIDPVKKSSPGSGAAFELARQGLLQVMNTRSSHPHVETARQIHSVLDRFKRADALSESGLSLGPFASRVVVSLRTSFTFGD